MPSFWLTRVQLGSATVKKIIHCIFPRIGFPSSWIAISDRLDSIIAERSSSTAKIQSDLPSYEAYAETQTARQLFHVRLTLSQNIQQNLIACFFYPDVPSHFIRFYHGFLGVIPPVIISHPCLISRDFPWNHPASLGPYVLSAGSPLRRSKFQLCSRPPRQKWGGITAIKGTKAWDFSREMGIWYGIIWYDTV